LQRKDGWIYQKLGSRVAFDYMARRMSLFVALDKGLPRRTRRMARLLPDASISAYAQAVARASLGDRPGASRLFREAVALNPDNQAARFDLIRPYLGMLSHGRAPPEITTEAEKLPSTPAAILAAGRYAIAGEWEKVPPLESQMAAARFTDAWYPEAIQMRADWRTRVTSSEHRGRLGREALALIEETIVSHPSATLFALRARSAAAADRPDILLESINGYTSSLLNSVAQLSPNELPPLSATLDSLVTALGRLDSDARLNKARLAEVRSSIASARDQLQSRASEGP
jgi:hypothetical protein